jgi:anaerobic selenocysteine-containing dehydrogenase
MSKSGSKIVRTTAWSAGPGCHGGCGVLADIKDGKLVKIDGLGVPIKHNLCRIYKNGT